MSLVEKSVARAGMGPLVADTLPAKPRGVKSLQRLIAALRATEAEVQDRLSASERDLNNALRQNLALAERVRLLEAENLQHRLKSRLGEIEALSSSDRTRLLEVSRSGQDGGGSN